MTGPVTREGELTAAPSAARCPLCGTGDIRSEPFAYVYEGERYPGGRCARCGFVFLTRRPAADVLARMYGPSYFESDFHCGHTTAPYFEREIEEKEAAHALLAVLEREARPGSILEVGSAGGFFLAAARERGWHAAGVEYSEEASRFAREKLGLDVRTGSLEGAGFRDGEYDAVYMGDVLEHVLEPLATLAEVRRVLRPGGLLLVAGPLTIHSWLRRLGRFVYGALGKTRLLWSPPYHLLEFTPSTLRLALERAGFEVLRLEESKIPPRWQGPAGRSAVERAMAFAVELPNWAWTSLTGRSGDRVVALARRR